MFTDYSFIGETAQALKLNSVLHKNIAVDSFTHETIFACTVSRTRLNYELPPATATLSSGNPLAAPLHSGEPRHAFPWMGAASLKESGNI
jgi:hypothetical protein